MKKNIPKRRFKEFIGSGEWEEKKLGEVAIEITAGGDIDKSKIKRKGEYPVIGNSLVNFGIIGYYNRKFKIEAPAITVTGRGDVGIAKTRYINFTPVVRLISIKSNLNIEFLEKCINNIKIMNESTGVPQLTVPKVKNIVIKIPSLEEQEKIGKFFEKLDRLIDLNREKLEKLKNIKSAYLSEMFPKEGELYPKRRFAGFTEPWEEKKLSDIIIKYIDFRGRTPKKLGLNWSEYGFLALSALNVKDGFIDKSIDAHYGDSRLYDVWMNGNELHKGQVIFTTEAPMGNVAQIPDDNKYILSQRTIAFNVNDQLIIENFLAITLRANYTQKKLNLLASGGTAKGVSQKVLSKLTIKFPSLQEQEKIGNFFKILDERIILQEEKIEKLENMKRAYLSEMFV